MRTWLHSGLAATPGFRAALFLALSLLYATPAHAQFGIIEELAKRFTDLALSYHQLSVRDDAVVSARDRNRSRLPFAGAEFVFNVKQFPEPGKECKWVPTKMIHSDSMRTDIQGYESTYTCTPAKTPAKWIVDIGFSYAQTLEFAIAEGGYEITGVARERPGVTIYATYVPSSETCRNACIRTYAGVRTGILQLDATRLRIGTAEFRDSPSTLQFGGVAGASIKLFSMPMVLFTEATYTYRPDFILNWTNELDKANPFPPSAVRRQLNFTTYGLGIGLQIQVRDPAAQK